ncbi:MAG: Sjogren's syndrome/scleroderma autoantigen 1 family protein [Haloplanus sp.]
MSGFDEEAERERLREKYEQDQEKRAATQRMSELLLKGATMTNSHCDACGDPLFRHDGQTFCPTCQAAQQGAGEAEASAESEAAPESESESPSPADANAQADDSETAPARRAPPDGRDPSADAGADAADARVRESAAAPRTTPPTADANANANAAGASLDDARASLSRTLVRYARAAEETDDPRRATELLAAAREAAETLAALDRR